MGKNPAFQFYPSDWTRDLDDQDLETEGAWIRIICRLWWSETRGESTKPIREWARILRKTEQKTIKIFQILFEKHIADGAILDNQNATIICRRMVRDNKISLIRQEVGKLGGNPGLKKIKENLVNQNPSKTASLQSSSSIFNNTPIVPRRVTVYSDDFLSFWKAYPKRTGKDAAWKAWMKRDGDRPPIENILMAIETQLNTEQWKKEKGQYIPNPVTWLNQGRWNDEPESSIQATSW